MTRRVALSFDGVAVEDADDFPTEVCSDKRMDENKTNGQEHSNDEIVSSHRDCLARRVVEMVMSVSPLFTCKVMGCPVSGLHTILYCIGV